MTTTLVLAILVPMITHAPRLPLSLDPLIAEAKRRMLRAACSSWPCSWSPGPGAAAGVIATRFPAGGYTSVPWTHGQHTQMRYCSGPALSGAALAVSAGVSCQTAAAAVRDLARCSHKTTCLAGSFRCVAPYWGEPSRQTFAVVKHALCRDASRRVMWDGG